jgi:AraC-like DNA-binding protein
MGSFVELVPEARLRPFVDRLWVHKIDGPRPREGRRVLPDGRISFVWISGLGVRIAGPQTRYLTPPDLPTILAFGASFRPGAATQMLRVPAHAMRDLHVPLEAICPRLADRLDERLGEANQAEIALQAFAQELLVELRTADDPDPVVVDAVHHLRSGSARVAEAAASAYVSERELQRRFAEHVGYGPKTLHRVLRFQRFLRHASRPAIDLADAAARTGYADQSHLTRETRRLAGLTPRQLHGWRH